MSEASTGVGSSALLSEAQLHAGSVVENMRVMRMGSRMVFIVVAGCGLG